MNEKERKMHFPKVTADNFFMTQEERDAEKLEKVEMISISTISDFPNHPYRVVENEEMNEFVENVKENGVIIPVLVRPKQNGGYEMISGHRRKKACELAEITEIPAIIREMTDEEAVIQMVDSNKQRERILPSEKAFAYKMKLEAMRKKAGRPKKENSSPMATDFNEKSTAEKIGEEFGDGKDNVYRYIRLTELIPEILKFVDEEQMKLRPAVEISYLKKSEQEYLLESIEVNVAFPSHPQAREMRKLSAENKLTEDEIDRIMESEKPNQKEQVKFSADEFKSYFPKEYTVKQMKEKMKELLQKYQLQWQNKSKNYER